MRIETKFNLGQEVYFLQNYKEYFNNKPLGYGINILKGTVHKIQLEILELTGKVIFYETYVIFVDRDVYEVDSERLLATKEQAEEILKQLRGEI